MKRTILIIGLAVAVLLSSCIYINTDDDIDRHFSYSRFNFALWGTWESFSDEITVTIGSETIQITGPGNHQSLDGFTRNAVLSGYSQETKDHYDEKEGLIHIKDIGSWQSPISYKLWEDANRDKYLTFFGSYYNLTMKQR